MKRKKPNANKPQRNSNSKIAPHRERDIISKIERINQELSEAPDERKPYLQNQRRRLEAMLDPSVASRSMLAARSPD